MKILRKPKLAATTCKRCGCIFLPKLRNIVFSNVTKTKDEVKCPSCKTINKAKFDFEGINTDEEQV